MSDFLRSHGLYSLRNSPGQNTGVGSLSLFQGIFPTQGSNPGLLHCRQILYQLSHQGSPRIVEWVAYPFSSGSSRPRNWTGVSCIAGKFFTNWALREAQLIVKVICILFFLLYGFLFPIPHQKFSQYSCYLKLLMDNKLHDVEYWRKMGKWQTAVTDGSEREIMPPPQGSNNTKLGQSQVLFQRHFHFVVIVKVCILFVFLL